LSKEFEIARLIIVQAGFAGKIESARAFAWSHRIHPISPAALEDEFKLDFKITDSQVDAVMQEIDAGWRLKKPVTFYNLETKLGHGTATSLGRMDLIGICRVAFLDNRFDDAVWKALTVSGSGPIESQGMCKPFNPEDDLDF
jgi:hypothetical protein